MHVLCYILMFAAVSVYFNTMSVDIRGIHLAIDYLYSDERA